MLSPNQYSLHMAVPNSHCPRHTARYKIAIALCQKEILFNFYFCNFRGHAQQEKLLKAQIYTPGYSKAIGLETFPILPIQ